MSVNRPVQASLFVTCVVDQLYPQVGVSAVRVLRRLGVKVDFPLDQTCCGQAVFNAGFTNQARQLARRVLRSFKDSQYVVVPSGSCAAMLKVFYLSLFEADLQLRQEAETLAGKVHEFSEFLVDVLGVADLGVRCPEAVAFHPGCHLLRELGVRDAPLELLGHVDGLALKELPQAENCCGFGGTFSVKFPHISEGMLADKVASVQASGAETLASCDMTCLMHIGGALSRQQSPIKTRHLAEILDQEAR